MFFCLTYSSTDTTSSKDGPEHPKYFLNFDLETIVTPVKVAKFINKLEEAHYDSTEVEFLRNGFNSGFDIGYEGPKDCCSTSENIPFSVRNETQKWNKIMKEVALKRVAGPYESIPFKHYIQSPIGLVPKAGGDQTQLIFHLSYDFKKDGLKSMNYFTPKQKCSVKYRDLDHAVGNYIDLCFEILGDYCETRSGNKDQETLKKEWWSWFRNHRKLPEPIFGGKTDLKSAFRILGLSRNSWMWLIMKAKDPVTARWYYFVDKCLPFGTSISCTLFQRFLDALCFLIEFHIGVNKCITNYLDDFLFIARMLLCCNFMIQQFILLCDELGIPISPKKIKWGSETVIFLGILLDGAHLILAILVEKHEVAVALLWDLANRKKATVKDLQRLCGYLNFLGKAIFPGRTFTRRMYAKYSHMLNINNDSVDASFKLKQHHHIRLDWEFKQDCKVWLDFLQEDYYNKPVIFRPMVD